MSSQNRKQKKNKEGAAVDVLYEAETNGHIRMDVKFPNGHVKEEDIRFNQDITVHMVTSNLIQDHYSVNKHGQAVEANDHDLFLMPKEKLMERGQRMIKYYDDLYTCENLELRCTGVPLKQPLEVLNSCVWMKPNYQGGGGGIA